MMNRPNIVVILADQLRRHALGCYGDPNIATPNIDRLAAEGVRFDNACSTYPLCVPFRFSMMTGEYAHSRLIPAIEWRMAPTERTLADEFNDAGYETVYIGKWHLDGGHGRMGSARQVGYTAVKRINQGRWHTWRGFELRNDPFDTCYFEDDDPTPHVIEGYQTDGLFDLGLNHMDTSGSLDSPFAMVLSVEPPHPPFVAPEALTRKWEQRKIELPPNFLMDDPDTRAKTVRNRKLYYAMVENLDENVGRLLARLESSGARENTVVVLLADHGELGGAHGHADKQWPYEESIGIPFIVSDPRLSDRHGHVVSDAIATEDIFPTLLGIAGLTPQNPVPGQNLYPLIRGDIDRLDREGVLLEFVAELRRQMPFYDEVWRGFRGTRYKYTVKGNMDGARPWQFFDLDRDPYELDDLLESPEHQDLIAKYHLLLRTRMEETDDSLALSPAYGCEGFNLS